MLLRMYLRWAERRGFKAEILDEVPGSEGGLLHAQIRVEGPMAFGWLKGETGIHRLVRMSPFSGKRETSFAGVEVMPEYEEADEIDVPETDLRIDTYRSSGAGGQHVNKTDSAVRITHMESGIVVQCQNERSQHKNKAQAMKVLKSRLYMLEQQKRDAAVAKLYGDKGEIAWGNQIRSYVMQPYQMVKDHRTEHQTGNVEAVMDGDLDGFIESYLRHRAKAGLKEA
jgi:peptide chain release factor 2